jgi:hypothetical protein
VAVQGHAARQPTAAAANDDEDHPKDFPVVVGNLAWAFQGAHAGHVSDANVRDGSDRSKISREDLWRRVLWSLAWTGHAVGKLYDMTGRADTLEIFIPRPCLLRFDKEAMIDHVFALFLYDGIVCFGWDDNAM